MAIPKKDQELADWSTNANAKLVASGATTYQLTAGQVTGYTAKHDAFLEAVERDPSALLPTGKYDVARALPDHAIAAPIIEVRALPAAA